MPQSIWFEVHEYISALHSGNLLASFPNYRKGESGACHGVYGLRCTSTSVLFAAAICLLLFQITEKVKAAHATEYMV